MRKGIDPSLGSDKQTVDGGHPVHGDWGRRGLWDHTVYILLHVTSQIHGLMLHK